MRSTNIKIKSFPQLLKSYLYMYLESVFNFTLSLDKCWNPHNFQECVQMTQCLSFCQKEIYTIHVRIQVILPAERVDYFISWGEKNKKC